MTTYAPQDGAFVDSDTPDLGYHYPANEDSDYDGLPDWWEWSHFATIKKRSDFDALAIRFCTIIQPASIQPLLQSLCNLWINTF